MSEETHKKNATVTDLIQNSPKVSLEIFPKYMRAIHKELVRYTAENLSKAPPNLTKLFSMCWGSRYEFIEDIVRNYSFRKEVFDKLYKKYYRSDLLQN